MVLDAVLNVNKGADQPAHPSSLISTFVIPFPASTMTELATHKISMFLLVYVAEQTGLSLTLSETRDRFYSVEVHINLHVKLSLYDQAHEILVLLPKNSFKP